VSDDGEESEVLKILPTLGAMERDPRVLESGPSEQVSDDIRESGLGFAPVQ
jgi:hypothetical protein